MPIRKSDQVRIPKKWARFVEWFDSNQVYREGWLDNWLSGFGFAETLRLGLLEDWYTWLCTTGRNDVKLMVSGKLPIPWWIREMGITKGKSFHSQIIDFIKLRSRLNPPSKKSSLFEHNVIWHPSVGRKFILLEPGEMVLRHHEMATIGSLIDSDKSPWVSAESYDGSLVSPLDTPTKETILFKKINKRD